MTCKHDQDAKYAHLDLDSLRVHFPCRPRGWRDRREAQQAFSLAVACLQVLLLLLHRLNQRYQVLVYRHAVPSPDVASVGETVHDSGYGVGAILTEIGRMVDPTTLGIALEANNL